MDFEYQALNRAGAMVRNTIAVTSPAQVYAELKRMGLTPVHVQRLQEGGNSLEGKIAALLKRLGYSNEADPRKANRKELPFFTTQMSIMLETGTQVADTLKALEQQMVCPHWKELSGELYRVVREGGSLASAMAAHPQVFDKIYVSMVAAGEKSGQMSLILNQLAEFSRRADRIRNKVVSAMIYPMVLMGIAAGVVAVLLFFVLPRFEKIFVEMNVKLPESTRLLLVASAFVRTHIIITLAGIGGSIAGLVTWLRSKAGKHMISTMSIKMPVIGPMMRSIYNARIMRLTGLLVEANVSLVETLDLTRQGCSNHLYQKLMQDVHESVLNGHSMHEVLENSALMDPTVTQMIRTGEDNSQIGKVASLLAGFLDDRNETQVGMLTHIMEPLILVLMGVIIGGLAISLVLPMFDLSQISG